MLSITEFLYQYCDELTPKEFYRLIFPAGELEERGVFEGGRYTGIAVAVGSNKRVKRFTVTDDLDVVDQLAASNDFCIMSPVSYAGKNRTAANARYLYALAIDVDGIVLKEHNGKPLGMSDMFYQFDGNGPSNYLPKPTAIVSSGTGVHVYYVFEEPLPCFKNIIEQLVVLKTRLTWQYWTQGLSTLHNSVQYESLFQGFRMPGTITKVGTRARAFLVGDGKKVTIDYLNQFVPEDYRVKSLIYKSKLTLAQAAKKYPEWYERRIVQQQPKGRWICKRDLYDWWIRQIKEKAKEGGRYWAVLALAAYAVKCGIPRKELENDALALVEPLDELTTNENNHFTADDALHAIEAYNDSYVTYPRKTIAERSMIPIQANKRNHRKRADHIKLMNFVRDEINDNKNWREGNGRPSAENKVREWQQQHPEGRKVDCQRDTGLDPKTVRKWWASEQND